MGIMQIPTTTLKFPLPQNEVPSASISDSTNGRNTSALDGKLASHNIIMQLINSFDLAAREVYNLLSSDPWQRFRFTKNFLFGRLNFSINERVNYFFSFLLLRLA